MDSTLLKEKKKMVDYEHIYRWIFFENDNLICNGTLFIMLPRNEAIKSVWLWEREEYSIGASKFEAKIDREVIEWVYVLIPILIYD